MSLEERHVSPSGIIHSGGLTSSEGRRYPIVRGIPRFVGEEHYSASFGFEWNRWPRVQFESENVGTPMEGYTLRMWERVTGVTDDQVRGKTIVEFGCGPGRFLDVVRRKGGRAVGIDLSQAVEAARRNFADDPEVLVVQGDVLNPPFRPGAFDGGYTVGVLHHTPEPAAGLAALARAVKPGGWVNCCVYTRGSFYDFPSVAAFRWLHNRVFAPVLGYRPALAYSQFSARVLTPLLRSARRLPGGTRFAGRVGKYLLPWLDIPDARWRVLDVFDGITPSHASTHTESEVHDWLRQAGLTGAMTTDWCPTSATAYKPLAPQPVALV